MAKKYFFYFLLLFLLPLFLLAQKKGVSKRLYKSASITIPYSLIYINCDSSDQELPLLLFLHGAGERGNDNTSQLEVGLPRLIKNINQPCLIVAPQCPKNEKWVDTDWTKPRHTMEKHSNNTLTAVVKILDSLINTPLKIDSTRVYVTGLSMGGFGTWELIQRYPEKFSAAVPVCGGGDLMQCGNLLNIPIWAFHGKKDKLVPVSRTMNMVDEINRQGGKAKVTIFESKGHLCWDEVYSDNKVVEWLMSKQK